MKLGIIGFGYWGKIIYKNLKILGYNDIFICEINQVDLNQVFNEDRNKIVKNYKDLNVDRVFVTTQTIEHFDICSFFIQKKIPVFCEKPLTESLTKSNMLYELSEKFKTQLYVDWIFTKNEGVEKIKEIINKKLFGELLSINMRRLNKGPVRLDVDSRIDLSVHDLSVVFFLLGDKTITSKNNLDFKRNHTSKKNDSNITLIQFSTVNCFIETSWEYPIKDRTCIFEFEKNKVVWDDLNQIVSFDSTKISYNSSPLIQSIKSFFDGEINKDLTLKINQFYENSI